MNKRKLIIDNQKDNFRKIFFIIFLFGISSIFFSQEIDYKINKPSKLYVGTPFHLLVDLTTDPADSIFSPQIDTLDIFILKGEIQQSEEIIEDKKLTKLDLTFQPFDVGEFTFPELEFAVKSGNDMTILKTSEFILNIQSVISDTTKVIKDIAKPLNVNLGFFDYLLPIVILTGIIFLIIYLRKFLKKKSEIPEEPKMIDSRPAFEIALEFLKKLKKDKLLQKGDFLNFHFRLSFILRLFIELFYKINAVEMTTSEIRQNLVLKDFNEKNRILEFLTFADKIKFAKFIPVMKDSEDALNWLEKYLRSFENVSNEQNKQDEQKMINNELIEQDKQEKQKRNGK
ncbi:MAG: hypothetical protein H8E57_10585 [Candidatus Cloacimonetes bacterium]|nr:hypothetical protein [Candidatus Cloacimonadota bacterium]